MPEKIKEGVVEWNEGCAQTIEFIVTEDCNLRCKYCYICHKKTGKVMTFDIARKFIDYMFSGKITHMPAVILDFIGGEPFLEIKLIDQIVDYFKFKAYMCDSDWAWNYRISATTNGVNFATSDVQRFIAKNKDKLSVGITIDGTKEKHDLQRVFPNGSGSYDIIAKNIPNYLKLFAPNTKVTFAHDDLPLLKESILHLWNIGITEVSANIVNEDVWQDGDDAIFEEQLKNLADEIIENKLYTKYSVTLFDNYIGRPSDEQRMMNTVCGAGVMLAVGPDGKIYPCMRYKDYSIESDKPEVSIGDVESGIDFEKVLRFRLSSCYLQFDDECANCDIAVGCSFCQGHSYDAADSATNFQRAKYICKMYKARVRANRYYFNRIHNETDINISMAELPKKMYFVLSEDFTSFCEMNAKKSGIDRKKTIGKMENSMIVRGLEFCEKNFYEPFFLHPLSSPNLLILKEYTKMKITHIVSANHWKLVKESGVKDYILVFDKNNFSELVDHQNYIILNIDWTEIKELSKYAITLFTITDRINLNIQGEQKSEYYKVYAEQLSKISGYIQDSWLKNNRPIEFNKLTDVFFVKNQEACNAGEKSLAMFSDGSFYICPYDYYNDGVEIGNIYSGKINIPNKKLYQLKNAPLCSSCPATHCVRCAVYNRNHTGEVNIPSLDKCEVAIKIEYNIARDLKSKMDKKNEFRELKEYPYKNPYEYFEIMRDNQEFGYRILN